MINDFIKQFTDEKFNWIKEKNQFYLVQPKLLELKNKIPLEPESMGICLGKQKSKRFDPSIELIKLLAKVSDKKVYINEKAAWLFICGRDVFSKSIVKSTVKKGLCLVMNAKEECIGYGEFSSKGVKNILDIGEYLRMER